MAPERRSRSGRITQAGAEAEIGLVGAISPTELAVAEADLSFARTLQSLDSPVPATNYLQELK